MCSGTISSTARMKVALRNGQAAGKEATDECWTAVSQSGATQSCGLRSQTECFGAAKAGSVNDLTATKIKPGNASASPIKAETQSGSALHAPCPLPRDEAQRP